MNEFKTVLLAEDDEKDVELTLTALEGHNIATTIIVVRDGEAALDYLYRRGNFKSRPGGHPIVVLLDLKIPKVDGVEVLRQMKADGQLKVITVVVLTSSREERDVIESYKSGTNAYVVKPVDFLQFKETIRQSVCSGPLSTNRRRKYKKMEGLEDYGKYLLNIRWADHEITIAHTLS